MARLFRGALEVDGRVEVSDEVFRLPSEAHQDFNRQGVEERGVGEHLGQAGAGQRT